MEGIFEEFENENALRSYPFAAGCVPAAGEAYVPTSVFVDAALYPVNPSGTLYLSGIAADGTFSVSDANGVVMSGSPDGRHVELYDRSPFRRHVGTLVASSEDALAEFAGRGSDRRYSPDETAFAASCVFPVTADGILSASVGGTGPTSGDVVFANGPSDDVRVSSGVRADGRRTLRFDVLARPAAKASASIRRIICVVDGKTPFRIGKLYDPLHPENYGYNTVVLALEGIGKDDVCAFAHREDAFEMADTCDCRPSPPSEEPLPEAYQLEEVFVPPDEDGTEGGVAEGAENAFFLVVPNRPGYDNPLSVTLEDGAVEPDVEGPAFDVDGYSVGLADGALEDDVASKAVAIQVPGLSGGRA